MSVQIAHDGKGYRVYRLVNGIYRLNIGPVWTTPKEAAAYANALDASEGSSPLRISAEDSDPSRGAPSAALVESSADVPRGRLRVRTARP
jgi:hypothetical protein